MGDDYTGARGVDNDSYIQNSPTWNEALRQDSLDIGCIKKCRKALR